MSMRSEAINRLVSDGRNERSSATSYKRALRACAQIGLTDIETVEVLTHLDYLNDDGKPYAWLQRALDTKVGKS